MYALFYGRTVYLTFCIISYSLYVHPVLYIILSHIHTERTYSYNASRIIYDQTHFGQENQVYWDVILKAFDIIKRTFVMKVNSRKMAGLKQTKNPNSKFIKSDMNYVSHIVWAFMFLTKPQHLLFGANIHHKNLSDYKNLLWCQNWYNVLLVMWFWDSKY